MSHVNTPIVDRAEMEQILGTEEIGYLALSHGGQPYCIPLSYAWLDGRAVIHCALQGRKLDIIRDNPRCCFTVSRNQDRMQPHRAEGECDYRFESILIEGHARVVDDEVERLGLLTAFKDHFYARLGLDPGQNPLTAEAAGRCGCIVIEAERMSGRRRG